MYRRAISWSESPPSSTAWHRENEALNGQDPVVMTDSSMDHLDERQEYTLTYPTHPPDPRVSVNVEEPFV